MNYLFEKIETYSFNEKEFNKHVIPFFKHKIKVYLLWIFIPIILISCFNLIATSLSTKLIIDSITFILILIMILRLLYLKYSYDNIKSLCENYNIEIEKDIKEFRISSVKKDKNKGNYKRIRIQGIYEVKEFKHKIILYGKIFCENDGEKYTFKRLRRKKYSIYKCVSNNNQLIKDIEDIKNDK